MALYELVAWNSDMRYRDDIRYRAYTTSEAKAKKFAAVPRIQFTDSGHGIVFSARPLTPGARRLPTVHNREMADYIAEHGVPR